MELWRFIKGAESKYGRYRVSTYGRVKNGNGKEICVRTCRKGYKRVRVVVDGRDKTLQLHRAVAMAFIPNPDSLPQLNHLDGNKSNNHLSNLQWCTNAKNMAHANANGLRPDYKAIFTAKHVKGRHKLTNQQIIEIRDAELSRVFTRKELAKKYNIILSMVSDIRGNKVYAYIR